VWVIFSAGCAGWRNGSHSYRIGRKMDFKEFLGETLSAGKLHFEMPDFSQAKHIGDTENHKVLYYEYGGTNVYGITVDDKPVGYLQTISKDILGKPYEKINQVYVEPQFRGRHLMLKLLFFVKSQIKKSFIAGEVQSPDGRAFIKSLGLTKRFPMFWFNIKTGEKYSYDPTADHTTLQPYRNVAEATAWRVLIEGLSKESNFPIPRFLKPTDWQRGIQFFDGWVEMLEEDEHETWKREAKKFGAHFICEKKTD